MKKEILDQLIDNNYLGCFGDFDMKDPVCKKHCAINLRCAIERDQRTRMVFVEEVISSKCLPFKIH